MRRYLLLRRFFRMRSGVLGLTIVAGFGLIAVAAPWLSPWSPNAQDLMNTLAPPTREHLLGTDQLGRDMLSRIFFGARTSMGLGLVVVGIGLLAGTALGLAAGLGARGIDTIIMRSVDMLMAFPSILLALAIVSALGPGFFNVTIAIGIAATPRFVRIMRASVLTVKPREFVEAARALGAGEVRVALVHVLPNALAPVTVFATLLMAEAVLTAAGLGFLGIGVQPPTAEWGAMLSDGRIYLRTAPHVVTLPGFAIMLMVFGFNLLGDGLRDTLDVRLSD